MNKVIKEEKEVNLIVGARNVVRKFGPRKLAFALALSSMLTMTACGKKEENIQKASVSSEETKTNKEGKYRNRPLGGKIVDNHNQELYISKVSDLESVIENAEKENTSSKESSSKAKSNNKGSTTNNSANASTPSTSTPTETTVVDNSVIGNSVVNNPVVEQPKPDLMEGESVTYQEDGSYVVTPSQDYKEPSKEETQEPSKEDTQKPENPSDEETQEPEVPEIPVENKGYVVLKKNYSDNTYFYTFTANNGEYTVQLNDIEFSSNLSDINSNVYALAENDEALSYALAEGWAKVGQYNEADYGVLDSVYYIEDILDEIVANSLKAIEEANKALTLTPEN